MGCFQSKKAQHALNSKGQLRKHVAPPAKPAGRPRKLHSDVAAPGTAGFAGSDFLGLLKVTVDYAEMQKKGHYNVTLSMGLQVRIGPPAACLAGNSVSLKRK